VAPAHTDYGFTAIRIEGGLLPPEYLQTINALQARNQANTDYGLTKSLHIKDEIGRYWRMASDLWVDYQERRKRADRDPSRVAVETWLRPLCEDVLGYHDLAPCPSVAIGSRRFPIGYHACASTVPLILTGHTFDLDRADVRFGDEGRRRPPHGLLQEYLNAAETCLWGMVANGNLVRLVRDNPSLTRPAFIEVDLERIFAEQLFADFAAFWLTFHVSRLVPHDGSPAHCVLEAWRTESIKTGERARENLRVGVTSALRQLGNGFLEHPANDVLRKALSHGEMTEAGYFQELLRLVYRLLFLFTVEDRNLLFHPETSTEAQGLYTEGYALSRLRDRALKRRHYDQYGDLWEGLRIIFSGLAMGMAPLGLPALGGLFAGDHCLHLDASAITNDRLLQAIRVLAFFDSGKALARVNYRDMGTEELGSVYESLLDLHPTITVVPWKFGFIGDDQEGNIRGSERKTTGSYYTPPVLVNELIKSALIPVIEHTLKNNPERPKDALQRLKIVDPACGSGHFLLAAARQVAAEIARLNAELDTPSETLRQRALREVVQHCIYGVDKNPLAVELCKTALWIETVEPGKPLSFLDTHIRCGDSLVGILDPKIMQEGIPDEAYKPLTGDEKAVAIALRRRNQQRGQSVQGNLFDPEGLKSIAVASFNLDAMPEDTLEQIEAKRQAWNKGQRDQALQQQELKADLFVGAFFAPKIRENAETVPLTDDLNRLSKRLPQRPGLIEAISTLARHYSFFHWYLAFPEVFVDGGFDVVLGNPPWERIKLQEQEFFASRSEEIAKAANKAARDRLIKELSMASPSSPQRMLFEEFEHMKHAAEAASLFVRGSGRYPLCGRGDVNTYTIFAETNRKLINTVGRVGCIVPSGIATDDTTKFFFQDIITSRALYSLYEFENEGFFKDAGKGHMNRFCLLTLVGNSWSTEEAEFMFQGEAIDDLSDPERRFTLTEDEIALLNPNTKTCPIFRTKRDAELTKIIYTRVPVLINENMRAGNSWGIKFAIGFHMSNDSRLFCSREHLQAEGWRLEGNIFHKEENTYLPLYEAKMIYQFTHRYGDYALLQPGERGHVLPNISGSLLADADYVVTPRYWVPAVEVEARLRTVWSHQWLLGWRDVTDARASARTVIASIVPRVGVGDKFLLMLPSEHPTQIACLLGNLVAFVFDYIARQKVGGTSLKYFMMKQFPVLPPVTYAQPCPWAGSSAFLLPTSHSLHSWLIPRILELTYTAYDLEFFARNCGYDGPPFRWDTERRFLLRCELDAAYFHLYSMTRDDVDYIIETFPIVKRRDEAQFGEYRTKRVILDIYDALQQAITTGEPYHTRLNPPPADPRVAHEATEMSTRPS
jgi:hypothetical protein